MWRKSPAELKVLESSSTSNKKYGEPVVLGGDIPHGSLAAGLRKGPSHATVVTFTPLALHGNFQPWLGIQTTLYEPR